MEPTEKIDLNAASAKYLTVLPGIPVNVAKKIVAFRKRHGGIIHDWDELLNVNGFPGDRLEEVKARTVLRLPSGKGKPVEGGLHRSFGRASNLVLTGMGRRIWGDTEANFDAPWSVNRLRRVS